MNKSKVLRFLIALVAIPLLNLPVSANQGRALDEKKVDVKNLRLLTQQDLAELTPLKVSVQTKPVKSNKYPDAKGEDYLKDLRKYVKDFHDRNNFNRDGILAFHNKYPHHPSSAISYGPLSYRKTDNINDKVTKDIKVETSSFKQKVITKNTQFDINENMKNTGYLALDFDTKVEPLFDADTKDIQINFLGDGKRLSLSFYSQDLYVQLKEAFLTKRDSNNGDIRSLNIASATLDNASLSYLWTRKQDKTSLKIYADQQEIHEIIMPYFPIKKISVGTTTATIVRFFSIPHVTFKKATHGITAFN